MLRLLRTLVFAILVVVAIAILIPAVGLAYGWLATDPVDSASMAQPTASPSPAIAERLRAEIPDYQRPAESTFLTYPEWSIVYAARDYARFVASRRESGFPYWAYVGLYWRDYATMIRATWDYPFNVQNHVMLVVIGVSHTVEHIVQSIYENTVGRLTELVSPNRTPQDRFQAMVAGEYAAFLHQVPWYEFPYAQRRSELLDNKAAVGLARLRSWEREIAFGLSYTIKQAYADLIKAGLGATSDPALLDIVVWAAGPVEAAIADEPDTVLLLDLGPDGAVFRTRRYQAFTDMVPHLVERGLNFVEIGGNGLILLTVLTSGEIETPEAGRLVFAYDLPADPSTRRTGLLVPVTALHHVVPALAEHGGRLEHIYDY